MWGLWFSLGSYLCILIIRYTFKSVFVSGLVKSSIISLLVIFLKKSFSVQSVDSSIIFFGVSGVPLMLVKAISSAKMLYGFRVSVPPNRQDFDFVVFPFNNDTFNSCSGAATVADDDFQNHFFLSLWLMSFDAQKLTRFCGLSCVRLGITILKCRCVFYRNDFFFFYCEKCRSDRIRKE